MLACRRDTWLALGLAIALVAFAPRADSLAAEQKTLDLFNSALFELLDSSEDGNVSRFEAYASGLQIFDRLDQNWDGYLTNKERSTLPRKFAARATEDERREIADYMRIALKQMDLDGDNRISRLEFDWWNGTVFTAVDLDRNGEITREEFEPVLLGLLTTLGFGKSSPVGASTGFGGQQGGDLLRRVHAIILQGMANTIVASGAGRGSRYAGWNYLDAYNEVRAKERALAACMNWDATRLEDINHGEVAIRFDDELTAALVKQKALQYCEGRNFPSCQCELVEVNGNLVLEIPEKFATQFSGG